MTYLDPDHARSRFDWSKWAIRAMGVLAVSALGYWAFTLGLDPNGTTQIVSDLPALSF